MLHSKLIQKNDIDTIFNALAKEYELLGGNKSIDIYLVGGASIILNFSYRMSTLDIDAYFKEDLILNAAIKKVSEKLSLPDDWINQDFINTPSFSPRIIEKEKFFSKYGNYISVFFLEAKYLIAMKLKSSRPTGGDLDDIIMMIYELRYKGATITFNEIIDAYKDLYPDFSNTYHYFLEKAKNALEVPVEDFDYLFKH